MKKMYLYPRWLRFWHWRNALLFLVLIVTGLSMHYSDRNDLIIPFDIAMVTHNIAGILLCLFYLFYAILNFVSGNYKHYIPELKNFKKRMFIQARYYIYGLFKGEPHPYETTEDDKFNPLQKITYLLVMYVLMPLICISGILLMFPEYAPDDIAGMGGVWPMAILHTSVGFILSMFMFGHIYLATHGDTVMSNFKAMFTGYHVHHEHGEKGDIGDDLIQESENKESF